MTVSGGPFSVLLIGAGAMGGSMLRGWLGKGLLDISHSAIVDPVPSAAIEKLAATHGLVINPERDQHYDICVLAVKPQMFPAVIPTLYWERMNRTAFISVAAGKSLSSIAHHLQETDGRGASIIRAMPNLPVSVGRGITLLYADDNLDDAQREAATTLMAATGQAIWVSSEDEIDTGMSISACGPAYAFLLVEAMTEGGIAAGLSPELAAALARETVIGASTLMDADNRTASELRQSVTSKGGTTAAALEVLDGEVGFRPLLIDAIAAATERAKQLRD